MQPATPEKRGQNRFDQVHYLDTIFGKISGSGHAPLIRAQFRIAWSVFAFGCTAADDVARWHVASTPAKTQLGLLHPRVMNSTPRVALYDRCADHASRAAIS